MRRFPQMMDEHGFLSFTPPGQPGVVVMGHVEGLRVEKRVDGWHYLVTADGTAHPTKMPVFVHRRVWECPPPLSVSVPGPEMIC